MLTALALVIAASVATATDDRPVTFSEQIGEWHIVGDPELKACMVLPRESAGATLSVAAVGAQSTFQFALSDKAWKSLTDGDMRLRATFLNAKGKITDLWDLDSVGTSEANGGPRINWNILTAKNDGASFIDEFRRASEIWFWQGEVPIAHFSLADSDKALDSLGRCRARLRADPNFDPFE